MENTGDALESLGHFRSGALDEIGGEDVHPPVLHRCELGGARVAPKASRVAPLSEVAR